MRWPGRRSPACGRRLAKGYSALTRVLGPSNIPLAEDVVHDALVSAMHAWRFGLPQDPKGWIIRAAHNRAIDIIRREQRHRLFLPELATTTALTGTIEAALAPAAEGASQLAMMFAVCDPGLNRETHVTLILRWLCGLSPKEIGQAFLVDTQTRHRRKPQIRRGDPDDTERARPHMHNDGLSATVAGITASPHP